MPRTTDVPRRAGNDAVSDGSKARRDHESRGACGVASRQVAPCVGVLVAYDALLAILLI